MTGGSDDPHHTRYTTISRLTGNTLILKYKTFMLYTIMLIVYCFVISLWEFWFWNDFIYLHISASSIFCLCFFLQIFVFKKDNCFCVIMRKWNISCTGVESQYVCRKVIQLYLPSKMRGEVLYKKNINKISNFQCVFTGQTQQIIAWTAWNQYKTYSPKGFILNHVFYPVGS